jgi:hypothetical protein
VTAAHTLLRYAEPLAVVRLGPGADVPEWASAGTIFSVTATATETSLVCGRAGVPRKARQEGPYAAFAVAGTLDHALTGVLASLLRPLADAEIPVFAVSTFDTDWVLVPLDAADRAADAWVAAGFAVRAAGDADHVPEDRDHTGSAP